MLDLEPEDLAMVREIIAKHVPNEIVWAYGSRVNGRAHEGSDLDLVIIHPPDDSIPQKNLAALREAFLESQLPILIDLLDWAQIPDEFRQEIKRNHEVIYPI